MFKTTSSRPPLFLSGDQASYSEVSNNINGSSLFYGGITFMGSPPKYRLIKDVAMYRPGHESTSTVTTYKYEGEYLIQPYLFSINCLSILYMFNDAMYV